MNPATTPVRPQRIRATERIIRPHIRRTPVVAVDGAELGAPAGPLTLKLELLQHAGSFKARGAFANLLLRSVPEAGVVAASGGNHGVAVAYAAGRLGVPARIFVPGIASPAKIDLIRSYGADLVVGGERYADALAASEQWARETGAMPVHAFDQDETLCGQGTLGLELEQQSPDLDTLLVAVGGGGLIGGIAAWYAGRVALVGVEPELAPTLTRALERMFPFAVRHVRQVILVSDDQIRAAQEALWRALRIVAEPGGAAAFAALLSGRYRPRAGERIGIVVCGGNTVAVDFERQAVPPAAQEESPCPVLSTPASTS